MKTNETPEKLYTDSNGNNPMLKRYWDSDVEYTRTDAFIEKACDWLERNVDHYTNGFGFADYALKLFLTDFKEYMKGE